MLVRPPRPPPLPPPLPRDAMPPRPPRALAPKPAVAVALESSSIAAALAFLSVGCPVVSAAPAARDPPRCRKVHSGLLHAAANLHGGGCANVQAALVQREPNRHGAEGAGWTKGHRSPLVHLGQ